jgi:CRP-like cAMP-binding protein
VHQAIIRAARASKPGSRRGVNNTILSLLPSREYEILAPSLETFVFEPRDVLHEPGQPIEFGYFPDAGVVSLVVALSDGRTIEVEIVGKEGFVGAPLAGGLNRAPHKAVIQVAGSARRITSEAFKELLPSLPSLRKLLIRYAIVQGMQLAQTAACNRLHGLEVRIAKWLTMTQDRAASNKFSMTHEHLAGLLGTDRPSVSVVAAELQKAGIIKYRRGVVTILSRRKLKARACECYEVLQEYYSDLSQK